LTLVTAMVFVPACDLLDFFDSVAEEEGAEKSDEAPASKAEHEDTPSAGEDSKGAAASASAETKTELSDAARYDREIQKKGCEILTPALVAKTFDVPEAELKQQTIMGCRYSWSGGGEELTASFGSIRAHASEKVAARWFGNATKGMSQAEIAAAMEKVTERAEAKGDLDTTSKRRAATGIGEGIVDMAGEGGFQFEDVAGVGSEARIGKHDGELWVRVENLTFNVAAYKGPPMPQPQVGTDLKAMAEAMKTANMAWIEQTLPQRQAQAAELAKAIIAAL
jgi:hypothetical protein